MILEVMMHNVQFLTSLCKCTIELPCINRALLAIIKQFMFKVSLAESGMKY